MEGVYLSLDGSLILVTKVSNFFEQALPTEFLDDYDYMFQGPSFGNFEFCGEIEAMKVLSYYEYLGEL